MMKEPGKIERRLSFQTVGPTRAHFRPCPYARSSLMQMPTSFFLPPQCSGAEPQSASDAIVRSCRTPGRRTDRLPNPALAGKLLLHAVEYDLK